MSWRGSPPSFHAGEDMRSQLLSYIAAASLVIGSALSTAWAAQAAPDIRNPRVAQARAKLISMTDKLLARHHLLLFMRKKATESGDRAALEHLDPAAQEADHRVKTICEPLMDRMDRVVAEEIRTNTTPNAPLSRSFVQMYDEVVRECSPYVLPEIYSVEYADGTTQVWSTVKIDQQRLQRRTDHLQKSMRDYLVTWSFDQTLKVGRIPDEFEVTKKKMDACYAEGDNLIALSNAGKDVLEVRRALRKVEVACAWRPKG